MVGRQEVEILGMSWSDRRHSAVLMCVRAAREEVEGLGDVLQRQEAQRSADVCPCG